MVNKFWHCAKYEGSQYLLSPSQVCSDKIIWASVYIFFSCLLFKATYLVSSSLLFLEISRFIILTIPGVGLITKYTLSLDHLHPSTSIPFARNLVS
jgi:hypothetical protein